MSVVPYPPDPSVLRHRMTTRSITDLMRFPGLGFVIGVLMTPLGIVLSVYSGGGGHGDYVYARALYPLPMLTTRLTGNTVGIFVVCMALLQFPVAGALCGAGWRKSIRTGLLVLLMLLVIHIAALAFVFCGALPNFSR